MNILIRVFCTSLFSFEMVLASIGIAVTQSEIQASSDRYWIGTTSKKVSNVLNWSETSGGVVGASVPTDTNDVFFDAAGNNACSLDVDVSCKSLTMVSGYTSAWKDGGKTITCSGGNFNVSPGGTFSQTGTLTMASVSNIIYGNSGTYSVTQCKHIVQADCHVQISKTGGLTFRTLQIDNGATVVNDGTAAAFYYAPMTFTNGGTFTLGILSRITIGGSGPIFVAPNGYTINGDYGLQFMIEGNSTVATIPKLKSLNGTNIFSLLAFDCLSSYTGWIWNMSDTITTSKSSIYWRNSTPAMVGLWRTNDNYIGCAGNLSFGANNATATMNTNFGSSKISVGGSVNSTEYNVGTTNDTMGTSQWFVKGNFAFPSNHNVVGSSWRLQTDSAGTIKPNKKTFGKVIINAGAGRVDSVIGGVTDTFKIADSLKVISGKYNLGKTDHIVGGNVYFGGDTVYCRAAKVYLTLSNDVTFSVQSYSVLDSLILRTFDNSNINLANNTKIYRFIAAKDRTHKFQSGKTLQIQGYTNGDLDSSSILSTNDGVKTGLNIPLNSRINDVYLKDISFSNTVYCSTCTVINCDNVINLSVSGSRLDAFKSAFKSAYRRAFK